jgi:hypothetical protein
MDGRKKRAWNFAYLLLLLGIDFENKNKDDSFVYEVRGEGRAEPYWC